MTSSVTHEIALLFSGQLAPFVLVIMAIVVLIFSHILRVSLGVMFTLASLCLLAAWILGFGNAIAIEKPFFAFHVDMLSKVGLKLLLPAVFFVGFIILQKKTTYDKKAASLLLLFISCFGAIITMISHNWMMFFLGIQCLSLPIYGLIAFDTDDKQAVSSSARYLVLSLMAMAFTLFGILLLYAASGTLDLHEQGAMMQEIIVRAPGLLTLGFAFILVGILFKASLFPFHVWAPEVYQGAPLFVVGMMVVILKSVVLFFLMRCFFVLFAVDYAHVATIISFMAILSMWVGNGLMLREKNFTRLIAYLSIGHLGYLMIPMVSRTSIAVEAIFLDLAGFGFAMLLIIAAIKSLPEKYSTHATLEEFRGLLVKYPWQALVLVAGFISMAGFPLTIGFVGKYAVLKTGVEANLWWLTINMVLSSAVSFFAIARFVISFFDSAGCEYSDQTQTPVVKKAAILGAALALVMFGAMPQPFIGWVKTYASNLDSIHYSSHDDEKSVALHK